MKRKTSLLPSRVYKFYLRPPESETAAVVDQLCVQSRIHYNKLITIERVRRAKYRSLRSSMFPELAALEREHAESDKTCDAIAATIQTQKSVTRSRKVDGSLKAALTEASAHRKTVYERLKTVRATADADSALKEKAAEFDLLAKAAIKALRKELYWGTYLLVEANAQRAKTDAAGDPKYDEAPAHLFKARLGVHFNHGISVGELATDTRMQILPLNRESKPGKPIGEKRREREKLLRFRLGTTEDKKPLWGTFAMQMHRPLPADARIKDAYITRRSHNVHVPWKYELCIVCESKEFFPIPQPERRSKTCHINFGWRYRDGDLRVAYLKDDTGEREILLPANLLSRRHKAEELRGLCADKWNIAKAALAAWMREHEHPEGFAEAFHNVGNWRASYPAMDAVWYWKTHRIAGDEEIFPIMDEWRQRYRHLMKWAQDEELYYQRWRDDFFNVEAKRIATENATVVIDTFKISEVAKKPKTEVERTGGQEANHNRVLAAPSDLRSKILKACVKYGCTVVAAKAANGTKRCNACGNLQVVTKLVHECTDCKASWDQDSNNTKNLAVANASGEVIPLTTSSKAPENQEEQEVQIKTMRAARKELAM